MGDRSRKGRMIVMRSIFATLALGFLLLPGLAQADTIIDTSGSWNGSSFAFPWGGSETATYGQTFTVSDSNTFLNSFSFTLAVTTGSPIQYEAVVAQWNGSQAVGAPLYTSSVLALPVDGGAFQVVTIDP